MPLEEYQSTIGALAAVFTLFQLFSPIIVCRDVIKQGTTGNMEPTAFIGGFALSILFLQQGIFMGDVPMISINALALILNIGYLLVFYKYSIKKEDFLSTLKQVGGFILIVLTYSILDSFISPKRAELISGSITTVMLFTMMGFPLLNARSIMEQRLGDQIPFPMVSSGLLVSMLWLLYGITLENAFLIFQNSVGLILISFQLYLCIFYSPLPKKDGKDKKE